MSFLTLPNLGITKKVYEIETKKKNWKISSPVCPKHDVIRTLGEILFYLIQSLRNLNLSARVLIGLLFWKYEKIKVFRFFSFLPFLIFIWAACWTLIQKYIDEHIFLEYLCYSQHQSFGICSQFEFSIKVDWSRFASSRFLLVFKAPIQFWYLWM